ncbi:MULTISPECIES: hypothetical protein [unclassified Mucilaginibacter]|uniref:hypothetical protein n=1 Tax=unclassified Mucilaginibacter TaxID=2617802 RepID=UPI002AC8F45C|nr:MULTISPECIES: hypothetical protein [unclassified Mucilaginibacter]MEB0261525.1 hypothetical protein [Mucilaginibacter sp. 10I4]MEB0277838.1 hypothetical protein [Mucilaginibacter sp. 10B2]MEB0300615.1 hypothetical protein [Mucilaginibacter sp. 5C4]WPX22731.1 hypothetical protein RHM67_15725 [Mucilaginibacter sp. 5C4]
MNKKSIKPDYNRKLNDKEQRIFKNLKSSFSQIELHTAGKIDLKDAKELLKDL